MKSDDQNLSIFLFQFLEKIISLSFFFCIVIISCFAACLIHYGHRPAFKSFLRLSEVYSWGNEGEKIQLLLRKLHSAQPASHLHKFWKVIEFMLRKPIRDCDDNVDNDCWPTPGTSYTAPVPLCFLCKNKHLLYQISKPKYKIWSLIYKHNFQISFWWAIPSQMEVAPQGTQKL